MSSVKKKERRKREEKQVGRRMERKKNSTNELQNGVLTRGELITALRVKSRQLTGSNALTFWGFKGIFLFILSS